MSTHTLELEMQKRLIKSLTADGFLCIKTSDRFKAGRPDLRIGKAVLGQFDVELKYLRKEDSPENEKAFNTGLTKLQWLKLQELNDNGMPAVGLVYLEGLRMFMVTNLLHDVLPHPSRYVLRKPNDTTSIPSTIDGFQLFQRAKEHLNGQR